MADDFTHFSCLFDVAAPDNVAKVLLIYVQLSDELEAEDGPPIGFDLRPHGDHPTGLWLRDQAGEGEPEHVIAFVLRCAEAFDLKGRWGFCWALTCSAPGADGFGGGAQVLNLGSRRSLGWTDCSQWLAEQLAATGVT